MKRILYALYALLFTAMPLAAADVTLPTGDAARATVLKSGEDGEILEARLLKKTDLSTPLGTFAATGTVKFHPGGALASCKFAEPERIPVPGGELLVSQAHFSASGALSQVSVKEAGTLQTPYGAFSVSPLKDLFFYENGTVRSIYLVKPAKITVGGQMLTLMSKSTLEFHENGAVAAFKMRDAAKLDTVLGNVRCAAKSAVRFDDTGTAYEFTLGTSLPYTLEGNEVHLNGFAPIVLNANGVPGTFRTFAQEFTFGGLSVQVLAGADGGCLVRCYDDGSYAFVHYATDPEKTMDITVRGADGKRLSANGFFINADKKKLCAWTKDAGHWTTLLTIYTIGDDGISRRQYTVEFADYYAALAKRYADIFAAPPLTVDAAGNITAHLGKMEKGRVTYTTFAE